MSEPTPGNDHLAQAIKEIARRSMEELWNKGRLEAAEEFLSPEYVGHDPSAVAETGDIEGEKALVASFRQAFPDLKVEIDDLIAEGDQVAIRWTACGTHQGEFQGIPATNRNFTLTGISIDRIVDSKIVESWAAYDRLHALEQLGVPLADAR